MILNKQEKNLILSQNEKERKKERERIMRDRNKEEGKTRRM